MKALSIRSLLIFFILSIGTISRAQQADFLLEGFYWDYPNQFGILRWGQAFMGNIPALQAAGFTYVWLPPLSRAAGGISSVGYDVQDYYDLGSYAGPTRFGTRRDVDSVILLLKNYGIHPVADMVFNQRAGGQPEDNVSVQGWIENFNSYKLNTENNLPYPSDRFRCYILLGDTSGNGVGTYYIDIRSASLDPSFFNFPYTFRAWTGKVPLEIDSLNDSWEVEPNQGGSCGNAPGDSSNFYILGTRKYAHVDSVTCGVDEFRIHLDTTMFNPAGDTLFITVTNSNTADLSDFSDQYVYGIYNDTIATEITSQVRYQTNTDFTNEPSGRGAMNQWNFKPNGNPTTLNGDWDEMLFYYDIDQLYVPSTQQTLIDWTEWMFDSVGIEGVRLDAVKNYDDAMVAQLLDSLHNHGHNPGMIVGEYYDGNATNEVNYINTVESLMSQSALDSMHVRLFDFTLRFALQNACDEYGYDERQLYSSSMRDAGGASGFNVVTFVNNHDFRDSSQLILYNPELAYAYILTNNQLGLPDVYYPDFFLNNFLQGRIKGLMNVQRKYIYGANSVNYLNNYNSPYTNYFVSGYATTTLVYQLNNPEQVIVALNFAGDSLDVYQQVDTSFISVGDTFTDIFGAADTITTITPNHEIHVKLPPRSFTVYVQGNHKDSLISLSDTIVSTPTGIVQEPAQTQNLIHVYPNPFSNNLNVQLSGPVNGNVEVEILDEAGRRVFIRSFTDGTNNFQFDPGIMTAGFYILKVNTAGETQFFKLFKH